MILSGLWWVIRMRLERMTGCLEGSCSIQLSYRTIVFAEYSEGLTASGIFLIW